MRNYNGQESQIYRSQSSQRRVLYLVSIFGLALRLLPLLHTQTGFAYYLKDSTQYVQLDNGLVNGCGFARLINGTCQSPELLRTPVYPIFLTALPGVRTVLAVQSLIGGLVCLALGMLVFRFWNYKAALICTSLLAFDIPSIVLANQLLSEQLFTVLVLIAVVPPLLLISGSARIARPESIAVLSGLAAAAAILTRPIGLVLLLFAALPFFEIRAFPLGKRLKLATIAVVILIVAIGGWSLRNYRVAGYWGLSTVGAINLYYFRAPGVLAKVRNINFNDAQQQLSSRIGIPYENIYEPRRQSSALDHQMNVRARKILLTYPVQTILMTAEGMIFNSLTPMRSELSNWLQLGPRENGIMATGISVEALKGVFDKILKSPLMAVLVTEQMVVNLLLWIGVGLAFVRCLKESTEYRIWCLNLGIAGLLLLALAAGYEANARFRVPSFPLLSVVAGLGYGVRDFSSRTKPMDCNG
jgi:hypothetical protein